MKRRPKTYFFICWECGKRKPQKTEESLRPGLCWDCYAKRNP